MCEIRIKEKFRNITREYFSTTEDSEEMQKEYYYCPWLGKHITKAPKYDMIVALGDMNAKVGREETMRMITGSHSSHHEANEHGTLLTRFAAIDLS